MPQSGDRQKPMSIMANSAFSSIPSSELSSLSEHARNLIESIKAADASGLQCELTFFSPSTAIPKTNITGDSINPASLHRSRSLRSEMTQRGVNNLVNWNSTPLSLTRKPLGIKLTKKLYQPTTQLSPRESYHMGSSSAARKRPMEDDDDESSSETSEAESSNNEGPPSKFAVGDTASLDVFYNYTFGSMQQLAMKNILKAWIKELEPKKSRRFPYCQENATAPPWWPKDVVHKEPDHLKKTPRHRLARAIIAYAMAETFNGTGINRLKQSTLNIKLQFEKESAAKVERRKRLLDQLYVVASKELECRNDECDPDTAVTLTEPLEPLDRKPKRRRRQKSKYANQSFTCRLRESGVEPNSVKLEGDYFEEALNLQPGSPQMLMNPLDEGSGYLPFGMPPGMQRMMGKGKQPHGPTNPPGGSFPQGNFQNFPGDATVPSSPASAFRFNGPPTVSSYPSSYAPNAFNTSFDGRFSQYGEPQGWPTRSSTIASPTSMMNTSFESIGPQPGSIPSSTIDTCITQPTALGIDMNGLALNNMADGQSVQPQSFSQWPNQPQISFQRHDTLDYDYKQGYTNQGQNRYNCV